MHIDLIQLIKDALSQADKVDRITEELDPHAPVELHFGNTPAIRIAQTEDGEVEMTSRLSEQAGLPASGNPLAILEALAVPAPWTRHECVSLLDVEGTLHLHAIIAPAFLVDSDAFSAALAAFYDRLVRVYSAWQG